MDTVIRTVLAGVKLGEPQLAAGFAVLPVFAAFGGPAYLTLAEAIAADCLTITEISEGGSVPELAAANRGELPVLILDGEELCGAKQNRVLNASMLIEAGDSVRLPVTCTERGRWSYISREFSDSGHASFARLRASNARAVTANLRSNHSYEADQMAAWAMVEEFAFDSGHVSPTSALRDSLESRDDLRKIAEAIEVLPGQSGLLVVAGDRVLGMDTVSRPEAYGHVADKLLRSYVASPRTHMDQDPARALAVAKRFVADLGGLRGSAHPSPGTGTMHRYGDAATIGAVLEHEGTPLHAAFFSAVECPHGDQRRIY